MDVFRVLKVQAGLGNQVGKPIEISHALRRLKGKVPGLLVVFCAPNQFNPFGFVAAFYPPIGFVKFPYLGVNPGWSGGGLFISFKKLS